MDLDYETFLVEKIPPAQTCFPSVNVRCGTRLITILGIEVPAALTVEARQLDCFFKSCGCCCTCYCRICYLHPQPADEAQIVSLWLFGFTCAVMLLVKDRKHLSTTTLILVLFLSVFVIVTVMFVLASVLLLMAALDEDPELMSYYIWLSIVYLCVQLVLAIFIPLVLIMEGHYPIAIALIWLVIVMIVGLGWTHFISVVSSYRMSLLSIGEL